MHSLTSNCSYSYTASYTVYCFTCSGQWYSERCILYDIKNYFMKMKGVSRDGGAKRYTNKSSIIKNDIATRCTLHNM